MNVVPVLSETFLEAELPSYIGADSQHAEEPIGAGSDLLIVLTQLRNAAVHYNFPISRQRENISEKLRELATAWKDDVRLYSSVSQMVLHPAYQQIIGMGPAVVPLLLRELEQSPDHWFWALKAITGVDPVKPEHLGRVKQMAEDWSRWGREEGYKW